MKFSRRSVTRGLGGLVCASAAGLPARAADQSVWTFDSLDSIGGLKPRVEGHPQVIATPWGKAIEFNGVDDALFFDQHPLAGFPAFTFEAIFRPDGGDASQRWFHLAEVDPVTGRDSLPTGTQDPNPRFTFELRVLNQDQWYLDAFTAGPGYNKPLQFSDKLHTIGHWYAVAQTYDGRMYRSFVDGVLQGEAPIDFKPQGPGHASVGTRINRLNYFRGAVMMARFTSKALTPEEFLKVPTPAAPPPRNQPRPPAN
jgi:hypothetical protein